MLAMLTKNLPGDNKLADLRHVATILGMKI